MGRQGRMAKMTLKDGGLWRCKKQLVPEEEEAEAGGEGVQQPPPPLQEEQEAEAEEEREMVGGRVVEEGEG